jgi:hypothetical protein
MASNTVEAAIPQLDQENQGGLKSRPREPSHGAMQKPNSVQLRNFESSNRPDAEGSTTDSTPSVPQNALNLQVSQLSNQVPRQDRTSRPVSPYRHSSRATSVAGQLSITSYTEADAAFVCFSCISSQLPPQLLDFTQILILYRLQSMSPAGRPCLDGSTHQMGHILTKAGLGLASP